MVANIYLEDLPDFSLEEEIVAVEQAPQSNGDETLQSNSEQMPQSNNEEAINSKENSDAQIEEPENAKTNKISFKEILRLKIIQA